MKVYYHFLTLHSTLNDYSSNSGTQIKCALNQGHPAFSLFCPQVGHRCQADEGSAQLCCFFSCDRIEEYNQKPRSQVKCHGWNSVIPNNCLSKLTVGLWLCSLILLSSCCLWMAENAYILLIKTNFIWKLWLKFLLFFKMKESLLNFSSSAWRRWHWLQKLCNI